MKQIFLFLLVYSFLQPCVAQQSVSASIQRRLDSLEIDKKRYRALIANYTDSLRIAEKETNKLQEDFRAAGETDLVAELNQKIGSQGIKTKLRAEAALFETPKDNINIIATIPKGAEVTVLKMEKYPFYLTRYKKKTGYLNAVFVSISPEIVALEQKIFSVSSARTPSYKDYSPDSGTPTFYAPSSSGSTPSRSNSYTPSSSTKSSGSSGCGSVQCSGTTKKGAGCRNRTTNCSGRCHLH